MDKLERNFKRACEENTALKAKVEELEKLNDDASKREADEAELITKLHAALKEACKALEFYGDRSQWVHKNHPDLIYRNNHADVIYNDIEDIPQAHVLIPTGGKLARQCLASLKSKWPELGGA